MMSESSPSHGVPDAAFDFQLYRYTPSLFTAVISVILFAILTLLHLRKLLKARAYYFIPFTIGGAFQTIGYCARIRSHFDKFSVPAFTTQALFILLAPALFAASIYMILGRLIRTLRAQHLSLIPVQWVTRIFVAGDVLSFVLQGSGGGIQTAGTLDFFKLGEKIIIGGLFVQIGFFGFFIVTSVHFHRRFACTPAATPGCRSIPWTRYLHVLYTTSALILIRSVFRVIEYVQGNAGYLISHEVFLYIFDTLLMEAVMLIFLIWYVDQLESKELADKEYLPTSSDDNTFILVGRNPEPYNTSV